MHKLAFVSVGLFGPVLKGIVQVNVFKTIDNVSNAGIDNIQSS